MSTEKIELVVPEENHLERLDKFLAIVLEADFSRSFLQKLIKNDNILVNKEPIKQKYKIKTDDVIEIVIPAPEKLTLEPQDIPINIVYEDESIVVINKQPGLVVHPGPGNWDKTLVNALLFHIKDLSTIGGVERPGIVHRLDKDTSGLMIIAKNDKAHRKLSDDFANQKVNKMYTAVVVGKPKENHFFVEEPIGRHPKYRHKMTIISSGKPAKSEFFCKKIWNNRLGIYSHFDVKIYTGRTHQIRVHLSSNNLPIVGDPIYSKKPGKYKVPYFLLASTKLNFNHPISGKEMNFSIDLPEHILNFIDKLDNIDKSDNTNYEM